MRHRGGLYNLTATSSAFLSLTIGCAGVVDSNPGLSDDSRGSTTAPKDLGLGLGGPEAAPAEVIAASGYVLRRHSSISPWCGAVLIDPSTAMTAAHCVVDTSARDLSVGFGALGEAVDHAVNMIQLDPLYDSGRSSLHDVARLTFDHPVTEVWPAPPATGNATDHEEVELVSYTFVVTGERGERRVFHGKADYRATDDLSAVFAGADTNCHGEGGAGLFRMRAGTIELLGIASSGTYDPPHPFYPECMGRITFSPVFVPLADVR